MSMESFPMVPQETREIDSDGMPLNGGELQAAVLTDLQGLVDRVKILLAAKADLGRQYAYPRVRWQVSLTVIPWYTDEAPVHIETEGGYTGEGTPADPIELNHEQVPVLDADKLRPEKREAPKRHEEASEKPLPGALNPMVRIGEKP